MGCYYTLYLNTYGYSLLFYKVYHDEGECRQLEFCLEKEQMLETYSAQLQKTWHSTKQLFGFIKKLWAKEIGQGAHTLSRRVGACPLSPGPPSGPSVSIFFYMRAFTLEKIMGKLMGRNSAATRRNQSRTPAELIYQGHFPPGGGNHHQRHDQWSSHRERVNLHQHLHQHHLIS